MSAGTSISLPVVKSPRGLQPTDIEWADFAFNPLRAIDRETRKVGWACQKVSDGCKRCYAEAINQRFGTGRPFSAAGMKHVEVVPDEQRIAAALRWRIPRGFRSKSGDHRPKVFVCDMTDLFGEWVPFETIDRLFALFALRPDIDWMILTKRPERMAEYFADVERSGRAKFGEDVRVVPRPNVWLGVSVENQEQAERRIPPLLRCPAAARFLSCEPLLVAVDLRRWLDRGVCNKCGYVGECDRQTWGPRMLTHLRRDGSQCSYSAAPMKVIDWIIVGGESGPRSRPCDVAALRSIVRQCRAGQIPVFVKQLGANCGDAPAHGEWIKGRFNTSAEECGYTGVRRLRDPKGGDIGEWPEDLRVREFPSVEGAPCG